MKKQFLIFMLVLLTASAAVAAPFGRTSPQNNKRQPAVQQRTARQNDRTANTRPQAQESRNRRPIVRPIREEPAPRQNTGPKKPAQQKRPPQIAQRPRPERPKQPPKAAHRPTPPAKVVHRPAPPKHVVHRPPPPKVLHRPAPPHVVYYNTPVFYEVPYYVPVTHYYDAGAPYYVYTSHSDDAFILSSLWMFTLGLTMLFSA